MSGVDEQRAILVSLRKTAGELASIASLLATAQELNSRKCVESAESLLAETRLELRRLSRQIDLDLQIDVLDELTGRGRFHHAALERD